MNLAFAGGVNLQCGLVKNEMRVSYNVKMYGHVDQVCVKRDDVCGLFT